jgi:predicted nucleic acid-binding protein
VPPVVVDTSVSLPATVSPRGLTRRFWVLLAYGAVSYLAEHGQLELDALEQEQATLGGDVGGFATFRERLAELTERRDALREVLPITVSDEWLAVGSAPLFAEYERKVRERGHRLDPSIRDEDIRPLRRQLEATCVLGVQPFAGDDVPLFTRDRTDDPIVYTALLGEADLLISDDRDIVPDGAEPTYEHEDRSVRAVTFGYMMREALHDIDLEGIDGGALAQAYAPREP